MSSNLHIPGKSLFKTRPKRGENILAKLLFPRPSRCCMPDNAGRRKKDNDYNESRNKSLRLGNKVISFNTKGGCRRWDMH